MLRVRGPLANPKWKAPEPSTLAQGSTAQELSLIIHSLPHPPTYMCPPQAMEREHASDTPFNSHNIKATSPRQEWKYTEPQPAAYATLVVRATPIDALLARTLSTPTDAMRLAALVGQSTPIDTPSPSRGSLADNRLCGIDNGNQGTYTAEGITKLCDALKGSAVTSLECAAAPY